MPLAIRPSDSYSTGRIFLQGRIKVAIPKGKKKALDQAMLRFDNDMRMKPEWANWEHNMSYHFAINFQGDLYPAQAIMALATNLPIREFTRHKSVNGFLIGAGFDLIDLRQSPKLEFIKDEIYDRQTEIHDPFGGNSQTGIAASTKANAIFLFTGASGEQFGYFDREEDGFYLYAGEGKNGPMKMTNGNRAILEHTSTGRALHLFRTVGIGKRKGQQYIGEYACDSFSLEKGPGENKKIREIIIFKLIPVEALILVENTSTSKYQFAQTDLSLEQKRAKAYRAGAAAPKLELKKSSQTIYERCVAIKEYARARSQGNCESCDGPAPFNTKGGVPYLEIHHTHRLSDGGLDDPRYVGAICPNCHREIHHGADGDERNLALKEMIWKKELSAGPLPISNETTSRNATLKDSTEFNNLIPQPTTPFP